MSVPRDQPVKVPGLPLLPWPVIRIAAKKRGAVHHTVTRSTDLLHEGIFVCSTLIKPRNPPHRQGYDNASSCFPQRHVHYTVRVCTGIDPTLRIESCHSLFCGSTTYDIGGTLWSNDAVPWPLPCYHMPTAFALSLNAKTVPELTHRFCNRPPNLVWFLYNVFKVEACTASCGAQSLPWLSECCTQTTISASVRCVFLLGHVGPGYDEHQLFIVVSCQRFSTV